MAAFVTASRDSKGGSWGGIPVTADELLMAIGYQLSDGFHLCGAWHPSMLGQLRYSFADTKQLPRHGEITAGARASKFM